MYGTDMYIHNNLGLYIFSYKTNILISNNNKDCLSHNQVINEPNRSPLNLYYLLQVWERAHPAHHWQLLQPAEVRHHDEQEELILVNGAQAKWFNHIAKIIMVRSEGCRHLWQNSF